MTDELASLGPFLVEEQIGQGGMGLVFRGEHRLTGVPVAIKVVDPFANDRVRRRFDNEVRAHARLRHPGVVYLFEHGHVDADSAQRLPGGVREGSPFVVMELADGGTLGDHMPLTRWRPVCALLVQTLDALGYAHARDVIHRDLKPENLLLFRSGEDVEGSGGRGAVDAGRGPRGWVKLSDFGIAHAVDRQREATTTRLESVAGTPVYMSPEQLHGEWRAYGPWTDLYSLGCVAWELVCGEPVFEGGSPLSVAMKHETEPRPPLEPNFPVPDALEGWIHRAMAVEPGRRFQRAADALWALPTEILFEGESGMASARTGPPVISEGAEASEVSESAGEWMMETLPMREEDLTTTFRLETTCRETESDGHGGWAGSKRTLEGVEDALEATDQLKSFVPPMPGDWRPRAAAPMPDNLVGTGLSLFGLREPPFVDREDECDAIWELLERVVDGESAMVFIEGSAGTGKSRLADWVTTRADEVGVARVLKAEHTEDGGGAESGLPGAFARAYRTHRMDRQEIHEKLSEELEPLADEPEGRRRRDARALTELLRPSEGGAEEVEGPHYQMVQAEQRYALIARTLRRLARRRPLVVWLDDLQWGPETLGLMQFLAEHPEAAPGCLWLGTVRTDLLVEMAERRQKVESLREQAELVLSLSPLDRTDHRELLTKLLPLESELAERLAERTEGHPLFAMQLLDHWIRSGDMTFAEEGFRIPDDRTVEIPDDIHQLWRDRVDRFVDQLHMSERARVRRTLELAAVLGRHLQREEWERVCAQTGLVGQEGVVDALVERGLAERSERGWRFAHQLLVDSLQRQSEEAGRRERHHRTCVRILRGTMTGRAPRKRYRIARHLIEAGERRRALRPMIEAIRHANDFSEHEAAPQWLEEREALLDDLGLEADDPERLEQMCERARMHGQRGELERAVEMLTEVLGSEHRRVVARAAEVLSKAESHRQNLGRARELAERAVRASREVGDLYLTRSSLRQLAWSHYRQGHIDEAEEFADEGIEVAEELGDERGRLQVMTVKAHVMDTRGDEEARATLEEILAEARRLGQVTVEAMTLNALGESCRLAGELEEARSYYREYRLTQPDQALARTRSVWTNRFNLALVELADGRLEKAREYFEAVLDSFHHENVEDFLKNEVTTFRLAEAAARGDEEKFDEKWERFEQGWRDGWDLYMDYPWILERAAEYAEEAGWSERSREVWALAAELWRRLDDRESEQRVRERVES